MAESVETELASLRSDKPMTAAESESACRAVQRFADKNPDFKSPSREILELYCALRRAKGESSRINAAQLLGWRQKLTQTTQFKRVFWLVPKCNIKDRKGNRHEIV